MGIDLSRLDVLVPEHLLDIADVGAALVHQRGHCVAEQMAEPVLPSFAASILSLTV